MTASLITNEEPDAGWFTEVMASLARRVQNRYVKQVSDFFVCRNASQYNKVTATDSHSI